jgi:amidohydrolase
MASSDSFSIVVEGTQTHGAVPWRGVDPITTAAQIVLGLQTITSRQLDLTASPAVISVGMIEGGVRSNIIPDDVRMLGTIRTLDPEMRPRMHERIRHTAETIASASGAKAKVEIRLGAPVTYNDPDLVEATVPTLQRVAGGKQYVIRAPQATGAEDFAFYQEVLPGMFYYIGVTPPDVSLDEAAPNHSPLFYIDEAALTVGARSLAHVAMDFLVAE